MMFKGAVVTGTDTGVGKTAVACALIGLLRERGMKTGALKPVETGCRGPDKRPLDALALAEAADLRLSGLGGAGKDEAPAELVVPYRFSAPLAPSEAARLEGCEITVDRIYQALDRWMDRQAAVVIETAGGVLVPLNPRFTNADLIQAMELPVVVVAPNRLGVINHAMLTLEALRIRGLEPAAVVLNSCSPESDESTNSNARLIREKGGVLVYEVSFAKDGRAERAAAGALRPRFQELVGALEAEWDRVREKYVNKRR